MSRQTPPPHPASRGGRLLPLLLALAASGLAMAQPAGPTHHLQLPAGPLGSALSQLAVTTGTALSFDPALTQGLSSPGLSGRYTPREAFERLLAGSELELVAGPDGYQLHRRTAARLAPVEVTGQRGGRLPAPYAGGQVARGARAGVLGNVDFMSLPYSVQAYTREFADDIQARTVSDIAKYDASVRPSQAAPIVQNDNLYIRGFQTVAGQGSFDGIPNLLNRTPPLEAFERVEVFKGPSAFLNGRPGNVGGTINMVPKRAEAEPLSQLALRYESRKVFGIHADIGRRFGPEQAWGIRVNGAYSDGETALRPSDRRHGVGSIALDYQGDTVSLSADVIHRNTRTSPTIGEAVQLANGIPVPDAPDASRLFTQPWTWFDNRTTLAVLRAEWRFAPEWSVSGAYGYSRVHEQQLSHVFEVRDTAGSLRTRSLGASDSPARQQAGELMLRGTVRTGAIRHTLTAGLSRTFYRLDNRYRPLPEVYLSNLYAPVYGAEPAIPDGYTQDQRSDTITSGWFLGDELALLDERLLLQLGIRHTRIEVSRTDSLTGIDLPRYDRGLTSPAAGIVFKPVQGLSLYGNYIEGLENGGIAPTNAVNALEAMPPLRSRQWEAGVKFDAGSYAATVGFFDIRKSSEFLDGAGYYVQDGEQRHKGLELNVFGQPWPGIRLLGSATWMHARMVRTAGGLLDGRRPVGVPAFAAAANVEWDIPGLPGLTVLGGVVHVGRQAYDATNQFDLPAWTRLDAGLRYTSRVAGHPTTLRLNIENLANRNYWGHNDRGRMYLAAPRTVLVSVTTRF